MTTRLELIKSAQVRVGDEPITSETDAGADTYSAIYDSVRDDILSRYPWSFATVTRRLTRLAAVPEAHYKHYYQLPSDMLGAPRAAYDSATLRNPFVGYGLTENRLETDAEEVWLKYTIRPEPTLWPGYFVELVRVAMMSEIAMSVREDGVLYSRLREVAFGGERLMGQGGLFAQAKDIDSQSKPSAIIAEGTNPLVDVRVVTGGRTFEGM